MQAYQAGRSSASTPRYTPSSTAPTQWGARVDPLARTVEPKFAEPNEIFTPRLSDLGTPTPSAPQRAGLEPPSVASNDILATPGRLQLKLSSWDRYQGNLDLGAWSAKYDTLQVNKSRGNWAESFGQPGLRYETPYGPRYVDNAPAIEIKTGYQTRSQFIRWQILKDSWLSRNVPGYTPLYRFIDQAPSRPLLDHLETFGIRYEIRPR